MELLQGSILAPTLRYMRILIANDDGVYSPGIQAAAEAAAKFGEVRIVAPSVEQSSMGHAITHARPLHIKVARVADFEAYRVDGTPADCVAIGIHTWGNVDVVLSGINLGLNVGNSMWHSGTLAAAKQAALLGCRGIALSAPSSEEVNYFASLRKWVDDVLSLLLHRSNHRLLNVNFPRAPEGMVWTKQSVRQYDGHVFPGKDPMGRDHFWVYPIPLEPADEGSDRWAIEHDLVSITPLRLDLTDGDELVRVQTSNAPPA
jgi:5'-nucleotidase